jgi:predicted lipoprotein with Yx(FWY)xxD motif
MRLRTVLPTVTLGLFLAACGSSYGGSNTSGQAAGGGTSAATGGSSGEVSALMVRSTSLGQVVTDGTGRTLYKFDKDTQGTTSSACKGVCLSLWPPAYEASSMPKLTGVTGKVGTITGPNGKAMVTLNGWPLYFYTGDSGAGSVAGQNFQGIWHVLTASGTPVMGSGSSGGSSSSGGSGGGGGYGGGY